MNEPYAPREDGLRGMRSRIPNCEGPGAPRFVVRALRYGLPESGPGNAPGYRSGMGARSFSSWSGCGSGLRGNI
jgi:hypothetical protein